MLIAVVLSGLIWQRGINPRAPRPDRTLVASDRMARIGELRT